MKGRAVLSPRQPVIALIGPPNSGKTTLFNALTGLRQKVANYPGVTVERKEGFVDQKTGLRLLDLPGLYGPKAQTPDELVTCDALAGSETYVGKPSAALFILDGSNLERSLALLSGLMSFGLPTAVAITMFDEIKARGGRLDMAKLSAELGVPVLPVVGHRGIGVEDLRALLLEWESWPVPAETSAPGSAFERYQWAHQILERCLYRPVRPDGLTARIDRAVLHPVAGPLIFFAVMAVFFQSIFSWATPARDALTTLCSALGDAAGRQLPEGLARGFVRHALFDGVGSVISFLPQILILFFCLFLVEDVGYMARAAFLMDRLMGWVGLQGRSFMALISSYACAVPGIMATRAIPTPQDRLTTMLIAPFMTCSARLPVYTLLISAFIPDRPVFIFFRTQGLVLLGLYVLGSVSALAAARVLRSTVLRGHLTPFYMELPPYRFPAFRSILIAMLDRAKIFLRRAGTIILLVSVVMWVLFTFPRLPATSQAAEERTASRQLQYSFAGRAGKLLEPVFSPIGYDWRINVGILASLPAREIFIATLSQIYGIESEEGGMRLQEALRAGSDPETGRRLMSVPTALSLLFFFVYALQCFSTIAIMRRETNGWRWPAFAFSYMFACGWLAAFAAYRCAGALGL
ncbi:MAG: ferrous iron transporter B [Elusimicrobia bacterium]|nr:ferrous iron transporter B [Elusimicrobiota bacterium]